MSGREESHAYPFRSDPLHPYFPHAAILEITGLSGGASVGRLFDVCRDQGADLELVRAAARLASEMFDAGHRSDALPVHPREIAIGVAALDLDPRTPTRAESTVAALFEQIVARRPETADEIGRRLRANLTAAAGGLSLERSDAIDTALDIAGQVARAGQLSRQTAGNEVSLLLLRNIQETVLSLPSESVAPIRIAATMRRLQILPRAGSAEQEALLTAAERLDMPLAADIGWSQAHDAIQDSIFQRRAPNARHEIIQQVEARMGSGFYENGERIISEGTQYIEKLIREGAGPDVEVQGRLKQPGAIAGKMTRKAIPIEKMTDFLGFRIIVPGNDPADCRLIAEILKQRFIFDDEHTRNYFKKDDPRTSKPYQALHHVGTPCETADGVEPPASLRGKMMEFQIRTETTHYNAEVGNASHRGYKEDLPLPASLRRRIESIRESLALRTVDAGFESGIMPIRPASDGAVSRPPALRYGS
ncbi:MAG: hypothetical protein WDO70_03560 [Alphaproteobacteria bacterium]